MSTSTLSFFFSRLDIADPIDLKLISDALPPKTLDAYFGLLYTMEDYACYGYQTNTKIKFVVCLGLKEVLVKDTDIKNVSLSSSSLSYRSTDFICGVRHNH